jgi:hypothetical protein
MPGLGVDSYDIQVELRKAAEEKIRRKFPNLIEGSSGWWRAMNSYYYR